MIHEQAGAQWTAEGVVGYCSCGWFTTPVQIGKGWMEDLQTQWENHVIEQTPEEP